MSRTPAVFIHGSGRPGRDAWPKQWVLEQDRPCEHLSRLAPGDPPYVMIEQAHDLIAMDAHVVGHSFGGVTALRFAADHPDKVRSLTLIEPAAFALTLDRPRTAEHVRSMAPVFAHATDDETSDLAFSQAFAEASGFTTPDVPEETLIGLTRHLRATTPPWTLEVDATVVTRIPTLVFVGATTSTYVEVADALAAAGAEVHLLAGTGHRPQDHASFNGVLRSFWSASDGIDDVEGKDTAEQGDGVHSPGL